MMGRQTDGCMDVWIAKSQSSRGVLVINYPFHTASLSLSER